MSEPHAPIVASLILENCHSNREVRGRVGRYYFRQKDRLVRIDFTRLDEFEKAERDIRLGRAARSLVIVTKVGAEACPLRRAVESVRAIVTPGSKLPPGPMEEALREIRALMEGRGYQAPVPEKDEPKPAPKAEAKEQPEQAEDAPAARVISEEHVAEVKGNVTMTRLRELAEEYGVRVENDRRKMVKALLALVPKAGKKVTKMVDRPMDADGEKSGLEDFDKPGFPPEEANP